MKSQDRVRAGLLFDVYGPLLTEHQQEVWQLYYLEDWSLAEIGAAQQVSRAAVYDLLDRTQKLLEDYEARLGLLQAFERRRERLRTVAALIHEVPNPSPALTRVRQEIHQLAEEEGIGDV